MGSSVQVLTDEQKARVKELYQSGTYTVPQIAIQFDLDPTSLRNFLNYARVRKGRGTVEVEEREPEPEDIRLEVQHDLHIARLSSEVKHYRNLYRESIRQNTTQDALVETLQTAVSAMPVLKPQPVKVPAGKARGVHAALALWSDLHNGEVVNREAMGGLSEFDMDIFRRRVGLYVKTFLRLIELKRTSLEIPVLHVFGDGDFISGLIHDELVRTNQVSVMEQTMMTALLMATALSQIGEHFEEVYFSGTPGNHGRNQQKVEYKEPHVNWDYICYQWMAALLKDHEHIHFDLPKSLWQITRVVNTDFLHFHGHGIRGWAGIPYYGINRALKELREALTIGAKTFDAVAMGHFHEPFWRQMPTGPLMINGCWKGGDEYALGSLYKITPPIQMITIVHDRYGALEPIPLQLGHETEEHGVNLPEVLPAVWAEATIGTH